MRAGVLGFKAGMTADWDVWGVRRPLTVIQLDEAVVTAVRSVDKHGYCALQVGSRAPKPQRVSAAAAGAFRAAGLAPRQHLAEFRVSPDALLPVGASLTCRHFVPGQALKVTGTTQGKGFQGVMKRHHFAGQPASHGNSLSHRTMGATGSRQDPGKVMKGKKMPGQMGGGTVTVDGLLLYKIDVRRNLLYVVGAVPGKPGTLLRVRDSAKRPFPSPPPFPTHEPSAADRAALELWAAGAFLPPAEEALLHQLGMLPAGYEREPPFELLAQPAAIDPFSILADDVSVGGKSVPRQRRCKPSEAHRTTDRAPNRIPPPALCEQTI